MYINNEKRIEIRTVILSHTHHISRLYTGLSICHRVGPRVNKTAGKL